MTNLEEEFYKNDEEKYELESNREFMTWLVTSINSGIKRDDYVNIEDYKGLIDSIVNWYELKYPGYVLNPYKSNPMSERMKKIKNIYKVLDCNQFLYRLPYKQYWIMECNYRTNVNLSGNYTELENGREVNKSYLGFNLYDENGQNYLLLFNSETGIIIDCDFKEFIGLSIEELFTHLEINKSRLNYQELKDTINNHYFDIELRHRLLELAALKILYKSQNLDTGLKLPDMGYCRARKYIEEFNEEFGMTLSYDEVDHLYAEYVKELRKQERPLRKRFVR